MLNNYNSELKKFKQYKSKIKMKKTFEKDLKKYSKKLVLVGALTRTRTANLLITNQLLYQLSYEGIYLH